MRLIFFFFFFLLANFCSSGQSDSIGSNSIKQSTQFKNKNYKNAFFLEAGGNGILYSINYERFILRKGSSELSYRIGMSPLVSVIGLYKGGQVFGLINYSVGKKKYRWESGIGIISQLNFKPEVTGKQYRTGYSYTSGQAFSRHPYPPCVLGITSQVSFRHEITKNKLFYRISFTCSDLFFRNGEGKLIPKIIPWAGVSFGKRF